MTSTDAFKASMASLKTKYDDFYVAEKAVFDKIKASITNIENIQAKVVTATELLKDVQTTVKNIANCKIINKELILLENVVCYRVGNDFYVQVVYGVILGTLLFVYSWFICCSIRLSNKKDEAPAPPVAPTNQYADNGFQNTPNQPYQYSGNTNIAGPPLIVMENPQNNKYT